MNSQYALPLFSVALGATLLATPMTGLPFAELEALNRELGLLCSNPPREAPVSYTHLTLPTICSV